ncbi:MAG: bifunctional pyr operon transcriptional regulator/uracil phosphoribosyltransferase PyrR [Deltaproteobacteria bacterium]|nr:bifunctional pyr operon transcriptional regulator/uracil phosphoribosyltransferase PyrR [Deltaproteobacteria bacterium]MBW2053595.1 bifunctional pyr operon transcriptional regulator/uracil phosphoribosyltransferase PyrR [Deltaproteobacteria bacterium]MBW2140360.1 bifunctional pyr operon transcriptional regulator/uracil phosphoribosyltransferase PyrR [Deltaproteobacteria bacterium]MBW2323214.1 bifunctional pyr operon transcriptional regulator/uracil phosphoribosyltransferase PyrR [Deltaproteob
MPTSKRTLMDAQQIAAALERMAREILASHAEVGKLCLVGIRTGGAFLAQRLQSLLEKESGYSIPTGIIDITLYRDDWTLIAAKPIVGKTALNFSIDDKHIILVDDVLFTGRTVRAALDALIDFGRPAKIELAVLVDRGQRELPICANYTGMTLQIGPQERINVYLSELEYQDEVAVEEQI